MCVAFLSLVLQACGQFEYCIEGRFGQEPIFDSAQIVVDTDIQYGSATHFLSGAETPLLLDIYYPDPEQDDLDTRPAVVLTNGGAFLAGNKGAMAHQCMELARRG